MARSNFRRAPFRRRAMGPQKRTTWIGVLNNSPTPLTSTPTVIYLMDDTNRAAFGLGDTVLRGGYINISAYASAAGPANFSTMAFNLCKVDLDNTDVVPASLVTEMDPSVDQWMEEKSVLWHWHGMVSGNMNGVAASFPTYIREKVKSKRRIERGQGLVLIASSNNPTASEVFWTLSIRFLFKEY